MGTDGPISVLTFRSSGPELDAPSRRGPSVLRAPVGPDVVGMVLEAGVDWNEVAELITESYCVLAPKRLVEVVDRPND